MAGRLCQEAADKSHGVALLSPAARGATLASAVNTSGGQTVSPHAVHPEVPEELRGIGGHGTASSAR